MKKLSVLFAAVAMFVSMGVAKAQKSATLDVATVLSLMPEKKKADADRYSIEQAAEASKAQKMREADATKYQIEAEAQAKATQLKLDGEATAEAERAKGTAAADVIRLKGLAEAEAKVKLAEAFEKYGQAAVLDIVVKMLPELAGKIAEPLKNIDKLTILDAGNGEGDGALRVSKYVTSLMATAPDMLKNVSGLDLESMIAGLVNKNQEKATIDISENK